MQLSVNLVGVLSEVLVKTRDKQGRVAAFEIMEAVSSIRFAIASSQVPVIGRAPLRSCSTTRRSE